MIVLRLVLGWLITGAGLAIAGRRVWWLYRLIGSGQPVSGRIKEAGRRIETELQEVAGQRKLLKWTIPGLAHFFTMWGFFILTFTIIEAWGALFSRDFAFWWFGHARWLGFLEDFFAVAVLLSLVVFGIQRVRQAPERTERKSRFYGSHTGPAWLVLWMIFGVIASLLIYRGAQYATGHFPYGRSGWPFASWLIGHALAGLPLGVNTVIETVFILANIAVIVGFLVLVVHSKHLHIFLAPLNVGAKRLPDGLGPLLPMESGGKPIDFEDPGEDDVFGRGKVEDFTWKGMLDFATCTECGRCQSQCPAWNTGKPLSPKLVIMDLRDHLFAKAPYLIEGQEPPEEGSVDITVPEHRHGVPESGFGRVEGSGPEQAARPLVGTLEEGGVIDPDVLWSCTSCGACVEQCPVDIEHVDHIIDMRRYQVLIESNFPTELGGTFKNLENKGNPWGQNAKDRLQWTEDLDFEVPVFEGELADDVEYLFWVGCAGAFEDKAKKTTQAVAELLHMADVKFTVLGPEETCTGDPARRAGNEFLFQMLAQQNVEVLNALFEGREPTKRKIVVTCPHCFNTIANEYPQVGGEYEVVHHTQLLNRLVRDKKLVPVAPVAGDELEDVTYHDPCYLGRHNKVYDAPRELVGAAGVKLTEMPRHADRSFCCGAGGARMWMEERIGKQINLERTDEALETLTAAGDQPGKIATGCPFCRVMMTDGVTQRQNEGAASEDLQVLDVAQLLLTSVKRGQPATTAE